MENSKILIDFGNEIKLELDSNLPSIDEIIKTVVENRNTIDANSIKVEAHNDKFDEVGFEQIIIKSVKKFLENIKLDEANIAEIKEEIDRIR